MHQSISKQDRYQKGKFAPRVPKSKKEEAEFGPGKIDIVICKKCGSVYYGKSWHHRLEDYKHLSEHKNIKFVLCPACQMIKDKQYEGVVTLINIPQDKKAEILNLVRNVGQRAFEKDPLDRIIKIKKGGKDMAIFTTENQLAVIIGKQIKRAFQGKLNIKWSHQESTVRIRITF